MKKFTLPDIGEGVKNVLITEVLISNNQSIKKNDIVIIVESEKASMEIPIDFDCHVTEILVKNGTSINPGDTILKYSNNKNEDKQSKTEDSIPSIKVEEDDVVDTSKSDNTTKENTNIQKKN